MRRYLITPITNISTIYPNAELKLAGLLGVVHILSVMFYGLSQGFFSHNSGNIFYFFLVIVFYAFTKQQRILAKHATVQ